jgi:hypothetical protein
MKKIILAAFAVMSLGVGAASAQTTQHHNANQGSSGWNQMATNGT